MKLLFMLSEREFQRLISDPFLYAYTFLDEPSLNQTSSEFYRLLDPKFIESQLAKFRLKKNYALAHFNIGDLFSQFSLTHPEYVKIVQIRDLRDACVSCAYYNAQAIESIIGPSSIEEKLMFVLTLRDKSISAHVLHIEKYARIAVEYLNDNPDAVISRFEDLIGIDGGGSFMAQIETITRIAHAIQCPLSDEKLLWIIENLFGTREGPKLFSTFREGLVGSWKDYFNDEHLRIFKENFGDLQIALGYSLD